MLNRIRQSQYIRNVATLVTGNVIAQAISVGASPILTRLYSPESFAALALFTAIVSSISPGVCGRYELAIVVAKNEKESRLLLVISLWIAAFISVLMFLIILGGFVPIQRFLNANSLGAWLLLTPLFLFVTGILTALKYYANSQNNYKILSRISIAKVILTVIVSLTLGWYGWQTKGLIISNLLAPLIASVYLFYVFRFDMRATLWRWSGYHMELVRYYKDFPIYSASTGFLDGITVAMPIFF